MPEKAILIDLGRQLFVDDYLIESTDLRPTYHLPERYDGNPILRPESDLELHSSPNAAAVPKGGGVWWDPAEQVFKMWYEAGWFGTICYATSDDGLHWDRPELDVKPGTNQVLPDDIIPDSWSVVPDWEADDPNQRYKMFLRSPDGYRPAPELARQSLCFTSPDGIHWHNRVEAGECGDRSTLFYNPFRQKWVFSLRTTHKGKRWRRYWEAHDFLKGAKWEKDEPRLWTGTDEHDLPDPDIGFPPSLYCLDAVAYESLMLGIFEIHRGPENHDCMTTGLPKITDLNFAYSRDGFHWHRPDRRAHIASARREAWDRGYVQPVSSICTVHGDTLRFYYTAFRGNPDKPKTNETLTSGMYDQGATGIAHLRRDGFVSMDADQISGSLVTRLISFTGSRLFVNADTSGGELRVELLDEAWQVIQPYTVENCRPVCADSTCEPVSWQGADDLSSLRGRPVRMRFSLLNGALFAFWVSRDATGRSDGYVAAGGPGFTSTRDTVGRLPR